ncbi:MAG: hypothetical protein R2726_22555, partial [Acidimicrobiales bacterium]
ATYVDGGVCQNIPVEVAVALGAQRIVAVLAVPIRSPSDTRDFTQVAFPAVFLRSVDQIGFAEKQRENLGVPRPDGCELVVIEPTVDLVGAFEVNAGLMHVDLDYGGLRAEEALADVDEGTRRRAMDATDRVVIARDRAWYAEEDVFGSSSPSEAVPRLERVRAAKRQVREALADRASAGLPAGAAAEAWWRGYEGHAVPRPAHVPDDPWDGADA